MQNPATSEPIAIAILAKAPVAGYAKTRLIPSLEPEGAARLQADFIRRICMQAKAATLGTVTLWCAPDTQHPVFAAMSEACELGLQPQPEGDLGARMLAAVQHAMPHPVLVIGTDCPVLSAAHLRQAAATLKKTSANTLTGEGAADLVLIPAEDGGYVLIGMRAPHPELFNNMPWSTERVAAVTLARAATLGLSTITMPALWDVDSPADLTRWQAMQAAQQ
jgi:uncharacterized protein